MRNLTFLLLLCIITESLAADEPSLVWVEKDDALSGLEPTIYEDLGDFVIIELHQSALSFLEQTGIEYEIIDLNSADEDYWLVGDFASQGFAQLDTLVQVLKVYGNIAVIKGDIKTIEERIPGLGFELRRVFRKFLRSPKRPLLGKGGLGYVLEEVSSDSIEASIRWLESFGTRYSYTPQCTLAAYGLYDRFQEYGLQVELFPFPLGLNVVATLPGDDMPEVTYIICGHYDSISDDPFNLAPGADDNASGTSAVLEAARVLKDYSPRASVKFVCFAGEEQGLVGSYYYARYADSIGMDIRGVLNFDMIGYCDLENYFDLDIVTDGNSVPIADLLVAEGQKIPGLVPLKDIDPSAYWSDHAPFWWYGYPAVCAIERETDHWNPYYHSTADTTGTLTIPFVTQVVKLGVAGLLRLARFFPEVSLYEHEWIESGGDGHADPGDTVSVTVSVFNSGKDASLVDVCLSSKDPFITFIDSCSNYGELLSDSIKENSSDPLIFQVEEDAPLHVCTLTVAILADSMSFSETISIMIGVPPVLVIDDDGEDVYEHYFTESLTRIGVLSDLLDLREGVTESFILDYQALIWLTGNNHSSIDSASILAISNYLDSGGNLFISGQDVEKCVDTNFYYDYLHAALVEDSTSPIRVDGVEGDPIGNGLSFLIIGSPGANNQVTPSIISPIGGADSVFSHRSGGCCGIKYQANYKVAYLSFGFEAITPLSMADTVMERILRWFDIPVQVDEEIANREHLGAGCFLKMGPNPFRKELMIKYFIDRPCELKLSVYDVAGRLVRELLRGSKGAGIHQVKWDGTNSSGSMVPQGIYFLRLSVNGKDLIKKCIFLR